MKGPRNRHFYPRWLSLTLVCLLASCLLSADIRSVPPAKKTVLVINEVGLAHPASSLVTQPLLSELTANGQYDVEFYVESLDVPSMPTRESEQINEGTIVQQYKDRPVDAVVVVGPSAINFMVRHAESFLQTVPVVICGSSKEQAGYPELSARFTGTWYKVEPSKTIDAALALAPKTHHIVVVGGTSDFDRRVESVVRSSLNSYTSSVDITYLTDLGMSSLLDRIHHLPAGTIILYTSLFRDGEGNRFANATTALPLVSEAANVPVFGMSDTYFGRGIVGGYVISFANQGKIVAQIVSEILKGVKPDEIPIADAPNLYMFDWNQLQHWHLSEDMLPAGSIVLNRPPTMWKRAKWILIYGTVIIFGLLALSMYLLRKQAQLKNARIEQERLSGKLISAQEDERRRIATELHDDFSQRLAMLSLGLETVTEQVPETAGQVKQQLNELLNSASELGADLHTLSHQLHSSTLERLGLVPGVRAYCKEFSTQHAFPVAFSHSCLPRTIPDEAAFCLFRIVQEALRNVVKHSQASRAQVSLNYAEGRLHLCISDDGEGFDPKDITNRNGLGLFSMQERAHLIGARLQIQSALQQGTRIDVWTAVANDKVSGQASTTKKSLTATAWNSEISL